MLNDRALLYFLLSMLCVCGVFVTPWAFAVTPFISGLLFLTIYAPVQKLENKLKSLQETQENLRKDLSSMESRFSLSGGLGYTKR